MYVFVCTLPRRSQGMTAAVGLLSTSRFAAHVEASHENQKVAAGIAASGVARKDIWLQTKIEPCGNSRITPLYEGHCYNESIAAFEQNLAQLGVAVVDLTLLHSPPCVPNSSWAAPQCLWPDQPDAVYPKNCNCKAEEPCRMMREQWRALEDMYHQGKTRAIG